MSQSNAHHQALAAFIAEHRNQLEAYVDNDKKTARIAETLLSWDREHHQDRVKGEQ